MAFRDLRKHFSEQLGLRDIDFHSIKVNPTKDSIEVIVNKMLKERVCRYTKGQDARDDATMELFTERYIDRIS